MARPIRAWSSVGDPLERVVLAMAGDWIPIRLDLHEDPVVLAIADEMGVSEHEIVGYLVKFWAWVSRNCHAASVTNVTAMSLERVLHMPNFLRFLEKYNWVQFALLDDGTPVMTVEKYDRWLSRSAKSRMQAALRKKTERGRGGEMSRKCHDDVTEMSRSQRDKSVTTVQYSTEENIEEKKEKPNGFLRIPETGTPEPAPVDSRPPRRKTRKDTTSRMTYPPAFESFWSAYPHRDVPKGKARAFTEWERFSEADQVDIATATRNFALSKQAREGFAKDPERFLKHREWCDFVELSEAQIIDMSRTQSPEERVKELERERVRKEREDIIVQVSDSPNARRARLERGLPEALDDARIHFKKV